MSDFLKTTYLLENISDLKAAKELLRKEFLLYVNDQCIPLERRLAMWEDHSAELLKVGSSISSCPEILREAFTSEYRGTTVMFQDLLENIIGCCEDNEDIPQEVWDFGGSDKELIRMIEGKYPKVRARFEAVFASAIAGYKYDW